MGKLDGKVALITGAARGQGRSHAIRFAQEGADLILVDVAGTGSLPPSDSGYQLASEEEMRETVNEAEANGRKVHWAAIDVADRDELDAFVRDAAGALGRLDIVVANHAVSLPQGPMHTIPAEIWDRGIAVNLTGVWNVIRSAVPHMIEAGNGGSIVMTSSAAFFEGYANIGQYNTSKAGLVGMMRTLARELGPSSIRVNTVHPSQVKTHMIMRPSVYKLFCPEIDNPTEDDFIERSRDMHLLPIPWLEPADITNALMFLVSDEGRYVTGVTLPLDGGATLK